MKKKLKTADKIYLEDARAKIESAIEQNGTYSHNLVSIVLRGVDQRCGIEYANELIDEYGLTQLYKIKKVVRP